MVPERTCYILTVVSSVLLIFGFLFMPMIAQYPSISLMLRAIRSLFVDLLLYPLYQGKMTIVQGFVDNMFILLGGTMA